MPVKPNREYRDLFSVIPSEDDYVVEGYATTFNQPYVLYEIDGVKYYEEIDARALDEADLSDVIMQYDHEGRVFARTSNGTLNLTPDEKGFKIKADLSQTENARTLHEEIKKEMITKMSWAFVVAQDFYDSETRTRRIMKVKKVYDVSAVSIPANADTEISARSFINGVIEKEKREALLQKKNKLKKDLLILKLELEEKK
jgi:HK97 family phage prohead protease